MQRVLLLLTMILAAVLSVGLTQLSIRSWNEARPIGYRAYREVPLVKVIEDFEAHGAIPAGTVWASEDLKAIPVTARWLWPTATEALSAVANAAEVEIVFPAGGRHVFLVGAIRIQHSASGKAGLTPSWDQVAPCP